MIRLVRARVSQCHYFSKGCRNECRRLTSQQTSGSGVPEAGLFGLPALKTDSDLVRQADQAQKAIDSILQYVKENPRLSATESLALLDSLSAELCSVLDAAELCRNVHQADSYKQGAEHAFERMSHCLHRLNSDDTLYKKLQSIKAGDEWFNLSEEQKLFIDNLSTEFEAEGIHLAGTPDKLDALQHARNEVMQSETAYSQVLNSNGIDKASAITVGPFSDKEELQHLKSWVKQYVNQDWIPVESKDKYFVASKKNSIVNGLIGNISEEAVRKRLFLDSYHYPSANIEHLGALIKSRQKLAHCLGYESFAHKVLYNKALNTPEKIEDLLSTLSVASKEKTTRELRALATHKSEGVSQPTRKSSRTGLLSKYLWGGVGDPLSEQNIDIYPWDIGYLNNQHACTQNSASESSRQRAQSKVKEYLSVESCVQGLQLISRSLFGISLHAEPIGTHEGWVTENLLSGNKRGADRASAEDVQLLQKFIVREDATGRMLGTVFFDLFERQNKFPGSAHFTVQCGCSRTHIVPSSNAGGASLQSSQQLPIVALVFHFRRPSSASTTASLLRHALLNLSEVETLHHEWGHALHSLLSETKFQHLSGTRGGTDFVEVPSHWFEYFARSPQVVSQWARHHITGERVPTELLAQALQSSKPFPAIDLQTQILYSAVDQYMFGTRIGDVSALSHREVYYRAVKGAAQMQQQFTILPLAACDANAHTDVGAGDSAGTDTIGKESSESPLLLPSMRLLDHGHFVNYGGGYYSYIFAKLYAAQIWHQHFAVDPLNKDAGAYLRRKMLQYGSSRPPAALLEDVVGGPLDPNYYLRTLE